MRRIQAFLQQQDFLIAFDASELLLCFQESCGCPAQRWMHLVGVGWWSFSTTCSAEQEGLFPTTEFSSGHQTVKPFARKLGGPNLPRVAEIIFAPAGEEAHVDYGSGPMVRDPQSSKYRRIMENPSSGCPSVLRNCAALTTKSASRVFSEGARQR
jgi:hypothetical protein